jgi:hypothetical protein
VQWPSRGTRGRHASSTPAHCSDKTCFSHYYSSFIHNGRATVKEICSSEHAQPGSNSCRPRARDEISRTASVARGRRRRASHRVMPACLALCANGHHGSRSPPSWKDKELLQLCPTLQRGSASGQAGHPAGRRGPRGHFRRARPPRRCLRDESRGGGVLRSSSPCSCA